MARFAVGLSLSSLCSHFCSNGRTPSVPVSLPRISKATFLVSALAMAVTLAVGAYAQDPAAGIQLFSTNSFGVDLASSNINFSIPIRSKSYFNYSLMSNSHAYVGSGGLLVSGGLSGAGQSFGTHISFLLQTTECNGEHTPVSTGYSVVDPSGASHPLPEALMVDPPCSTLPSTPQVTTDGSGYTAVSSNGDYFTDLYDKAGNHISLSTGMSGTGFSDPDGNAVTRTANGSTGWNYYDPIGGVSPNPAVLTTNEPCVSAFPSTCSTSSTYSYTDASGHPQTFTVTYTGYYQWTDFVTSSCSGISDINSATLAYFPTQVSAPSGAVWKIAYEQPQGKSISYITGRISQISAILVTVVLAL
jgi:hypothetical protein